ncbi:hypothetical protein N7537_011016 [Penicillium hordei]|uniref:Nephrocystin 3-like N-terminal domain-containing protein n=1 Tax=Penicillium hordei TaxID=40994 RepID=A0AAD6DKY2_9EURO|nr:uncharacterized protein N7537_011016 [Penicillium hordei]KAJ5588338.1 hypothetical protein N7537_011016 [Penicillium hordei]
MDPMSALSVATAVIALVDFGAKLVARTFEIRDLGGSRVLIQVNEAATELASVTSDATDKIKGLCSAHPSYSDSLERLQNNCLDIETQLQRALAKIKTESRGHRVIVAFKSIWSEKEIKELESKLNKIRDRVTMTVLMCIWDDAKKTREQNEGITSHVGQLLGVVQNIEQTMLALRDDFAKISAGEQTDSATQGRIAKALWASTGMLDVNGDTQIPPSGSNTDNKPTDGRLVERLLESLRFEEMTDRDDRIKSAYPDTFQWMFATQKSVSGAENDEYAGINFIKWLRSHEQSIFWITGKPASGKSTLMKYISTHAELQEHINAWAYPCPVLLAIFYFWGPGSKLQKSREGLLRSLLFQLLGQRRDLCARVAPARWVYLNIAAVGSDSSSWSPSWEWTELKECLYRITSELAGTTRLALFVDGLDEYEGQHGEVVKFLQDLHKDFGVKLCVSSRPWNIFSDEFHDSPSLVMETLTRPDIDTYIDCRLGKYRAFQQLERLDPESGKELKVQIRDRASGVFLWVALVVEQLLQLLRDSLRLADIWKVFDALPADLEKLYETIQDSIGPARQANASMLYQFVMAWKRTWASRIDATFLWLAIASTDPENPVEYPSRPAEIFPVMKRFLEGHTKGILQISHFSKINTKPPTVDFLHRTAFDWLRIQANQSKIHAQAPEKFDPLLTLVGVLVGEVRTKGPAWKDNAGQKGLRLQCIFRILKLSAEIQDSPYNRDKLLSIVGQMETEKLLPISLGDVFASTRVPNSRTMSSESRIAILAATWPCPTLLKAKCAANPALLKPSGGVGVWKHFSKNPIYVSPLEASVLGIVDNTIVPKWFELDRGFTQWQISQRLHTIKFLLESNAKPTKALKDVVKGLVPIDPLHVKSDENKYWWVVDKMLNSRSGLAGFDGMKTNLFPDIHKSRLQSEFPECKIE